MSITVTAPVARPASEKGALDGFESRCECCGLVMRSSLLSLLQSDIAAHIAYHERKAK